MSKVVKFPTGTDEQCTAKEVLELASTVEWETVVIVGHSSEGELLIYSSDPHGGMVLWLFEQGKLHLLSAEDDSDGGE